MPSCAESHAVTRIRTWVVAATTRSTNHYTITAIAAELTVDGVDKCVNSAIDSEHTKDLLTY